MSVTTVPDGAAEASRILGVCRDRLEDLNRAIKRQQWQQAAAVAADYSSLLAGLVDIEKTEAVLGEMVQLDIRHRRCMRQLSRQMSAVAEDIASLDHVEKAVGRSRVLAETIYRH
ncbi:MAG: hypothetical protein R8K50_10235 [Mariprofundus sp.]